MQDSRRRGYNGGVIHLYFSSQAKLASDYANRFLKQNYPQRDEGNFASFNMAVTPIRDLASECESLSLFAERKAILAADCFFLKKGKSKLLADDSMDPLIAYCENPNPSVDLILLYYGTDFDPKSKVVEAVKRNGEIKEVEEPSDEQLLSNAKKRLAKSGSSFLPGAGEEFIRRVGGDYARYCNEIAKLSIYANGASISKDEVKALVSPKLENDSFAMSNALLRGDVSSAFLIYRDLKVTKTEEISLLSMLSNSFQFMEKVSYLDGQGLSSYAIADELKANRYRVEITLRNLQSLDQKKIPAILERIYETSKAILAGEMESQFAFERFLANYSI